MSKSSHGFLEYIQLRVECMNTFVAELTAKGWHAEIVLNAAVAAGSTSSLLAVALPSLHIAHRPKGEIRIAVALYSG